MSADSCPIFEHLRGAQGVCTPQPAHFDLIATVQALAAQRDHTAAVERVRGLAVVRRDRAVLAATRAAFRDGRLIGSRQVEQIEQAMQEPVRLIPAVQRVAVTR